MGNWGGHESSLLEDELTDSVCTTVNRGEIISMLNSNTMCLYVLLECVDVCPYLCMYVYVCGWMMDGEMDS